MAEDPEFRSAFQAVTNERRRDLQSETEPAARNSRKKWTAPEIEVALRDDLTAEEKSLALGRTFYAVQHMIKRVRQGDVPGRML